MSERLEDTLRRLARERDEADRRYNDALTALDHAHPGPPRIPRPRAPFDEHQLAALNEAWRTILEPPAGRGVKARLTGFVWHVVAPYLQRQLTFNSLLVDHLNRTTAASRESHRAAEELAAALEARFAALHEFTARLLLYLQQITAYVDTKDRDSAGGALILNASLSGMAENLDKRWESLGARLDSRLAALAANQETLTSKVAVAHQASLAVKREIERAITADREPARHTQPVDGPAQPASQSDRPAFGAALDSFKYVGFEDRFRGSRESIRDRLQSYVPHFTGAGDVLDIGCGRGEFLELLAQAGVGARGVDVNHEMVESCLARGLDAVEADAVGYLASLADGALGGIFAAQVVEHLEPSYLLRLLDLAFHKLRPGAPIVLETINPACWTAFFDSFLRDITHVWPLHPDTLEYLVLASGFTQAKVEYRSPVAPGDRLQEIAVESRSGLEVLADTFNQNVQKLNARLFSHRDYALIGTR